DFDQLLQRIHPAESRIRKLSQEAPAMLIVFDLLAETRGRSLIEMPLRERRPQLEAFAKARFQRGGSLHLSPATVKLAQARRRLHRPGPGRPEPLEHGALGRMAAAGAAAHRRGRLRSLHGGPFSPRHYVPALAA